DAFDRSPPARVEHAYGPVPGVDKNNRQAIGGLYAKQQAGSRRDQAVAGKLRFGRRIDKMNDVGMYLAQRHQRPRFLYDAEVAQKRGAVALDGGFGVVLG